MRHLSTVRVAVAFLAATVFASCDKDNQEISPVTEADKEYRFVRLLVTDEQASTLTQITPATAALASFNTKFPLASLYPTASGRFAAVLYQNQNLVEMFDTGLESHTDHVDVKGTPKWGTLTADGGKPTHFKSKGTESLVFNDRDGTLSVGYDTDVHTPGAKFKVINASLLPHHGAMAQFTNGTYAVTMTKVSGTNPTLVRIINKAGAEVHPAKQETGFIHGNASDGSNAVFGCFTTTANTSGSVLVVKESGEQRLIPNPADFGAFRLANIYYAASAKKFIGFVATKGAYLIDITTDKITPIYAGADAFQCKPDYAGSNLHVLTLDGKLRVYDLTTGTLKKEGSVIPATSAADAYKPILEASEKFAYIALPSLGEVHQIQLSNLSTVAQHKVTSRPVRLTLLGFESNAGHGD